MKNDPEFRDMAAAIAKDCIVTQALGRFLEQVLEEVHMSKIEPLRALLAEKEAEIKRLREATPTPPEGAAP